MVTREYVCDMDGYFIVKRPVSAPTQEVCPVCLVPADRVYTRAPTFGFKGTDIPNKTNDFSEYRDWQHKAWKDMKDRTHPDNMKQYKGLKNLTEKTESGKAR